MPSTNNNNEYEPGIVEYRLKKIAGGMVKDISKAMADGNIEKALKAMEYYSYTIAAVKGAAMGSRLGPVGAVGGAAVGIAQQLTMDKVSEEAIDLAAQGIRSSMPSFSDAESRMLAMASSSAAMGAAGLKSYITKHAESFRRFANKVGDSFVGPMPAYPHGTGPSAHSFLDSHNSSSISKKPILENRPASDIWSSHESTSYSVESYSGRTAKEIVSDNPLVMKSYAKEMEKITGMNLHPEQRTLLAQELRATEFKKVDPEMSKVHRAEFDKNVKNLRQQWSQHTGQTWPTYDKTYYKTDGSVHKAIGAPYDAHHIIKLDHLGPNQWWNIHPAHYKEQHTKIHGKDSQARQIFDNLKKN